MSNHEIINSWELVQTEHENNGICPHKELQHA